MDRLGLKFRNPNMEMNFQKDEDQEKLILLKTYLYFKTLIGIVELFTYIITNFSSTGWGESLLSAIIYGLLAIFSYKLKNKLSLVTNALQIISPTTTFLIQILIGKDGGFSQDALFMIGAYKTMNMICLFWLGTQFLSNTLCYAIAITLYFVQFSSKYSQYITLNYFFAAICLVVFKCVIDIEKRKKFLFMNKDKQWNFIMEGITDNLLAILKFNKQQDQLCLRQASCKFKEQFDIENDKSLRAFLRQFKVYDKNQMSNDLNSRVLLNNIINEILLKVDMNNECYTLESEIRKYFKSQKKKQSSKDDFIDRQFLYGIRQLEKCKPYQLFDITTLYGYDYEPYIILIMKPSKNLKNVQKTSEVLALKKIIKDIYFKHFQELNQFFNFTKLLTSSKAIYMKKFQSIINQKRFYSLFDYFQMLNLRLFLEQMFNFKFCKEKCEIQEFYIDDLCKYFQLYLKKFKRIVRFNSTSSKQKVYNYKKIILWIMTIFIDNCIKYTSKNTIINMDINNSKNPRVLKISIYDNGLGLDLQKQIKILKSYKPKCDGSFGIEITNYPIFDLEIKSTQRKGFMISKMLISLVGPYNYFKLKQFGGTHICFKIYKDISLNNLSPPSSSLFI